MAGSKSYKDLKTELDDIINSLESDEIDIDEAKKLFKKARKLTDEIEKYLSNIKSELDITKPKQ